MSSDLHMSAAPGVAHASVRGRLLVLRRFGVLLVLAVLVAAVALGSPAFLSPQNLLNIVSQWTPVGIMAVGATFVILAGGFDLSAASGFALSAVVAALLATHGVAVELAFLAAIFVGMLVGVGNAVLVVILRINPFIATLASGFVVAGIPFVLVSNPFIMVSEPSFGALGTGSFMGIPYSALVLGGFLILGAVVLGRTPYGQWVYSVGGNPEASRLFGIRVGGVTASTYVISGFCMGAAAIISASQLSYSASDQDPALIFNVIVAVVMGGTSLAGGFGAMWRTAVGLAILAILQNGLNLMQFNSASQYIVKGLIIIAALGIDVWMRSLEEGTRGRLPMEDKAAQEPAAGGKP